jgi:hypothetical protein
MISGSAWSLPTMDIEPVIAALGGRYDADGAKVIERVLRAYNGTIPDELLISEAALALAIFRRGRDRLG